MNCQIRFIQYSEHQASNCTKILKSSKVDKFFSVINVLVLQRDSVMNFLTLKYVNNDWRLNSLHREGSCISLPQYYCHFHVMYKTSLNFSSPPCFKYFFHSEDDLQGILKNKVRQWWVEFQDRWWKLSQTGRVW